MEQQMLPIGENIQPQDNSFQQQNQNGQQYQKQQQQYQYQGQSNTFQINNNTTPAYAHNMQYPTVIKCVQCGNINQTRTSTNTITIVAALWCLIGGCFCCLIPGCCKKQEEITHYCSVCNSFAGKRPAECL